MDPMKSPDTRGGYASTAWRQTSIPSPALYFALRTAGAADGNVKVGAKSPRVQIPARRVSRFAFRRPKRRSVPAVRVAHRRHHAEHVVPRLLSGHDGVGEHAAVPADVAQLRFDLAAVVAQPVAGVL